MVKRRGKIDDLLQNELEKLQQQSLVEGEYDFDYCVKTFLDELELKNLSYHTRRWHKENLHCVKKALEGLHLPLQPVNMTEKDIKQCILYWKRERHLSPVTINHRVRSLKQMFEFLCNEGILNHNLMEKFEKLKTAKVIIRPFQEDELRKLFSQPDKSTFVGFRDYTIMLVLLDTGVRLIELENMKISDVDLGNNKIVVFGKGAKEREVVFQSTTKQYLHRFLIIRGQLEYDSLWISDIGEPMKRRNIQQRLKIYGDKAGLTNVRVSPHTFRHTCAKLYIMRGGDILSLQKLLGHSSLEMVRHYVNLWGSDLQQMHKKFSPVEGLFN